MSVTRLATSAGFVGVATTPDSAWNARITKHHRRVVVSLLALGLDLEQAQELAQETWILLIEREREGRLERIKLPGLALRQARYLALEARRRRREVLPGEMPETPDPAAGVDDVVAGRRDVARARGVLATASPRAREVFSLVYGPRNASHREAAAEVGLSLQRARQMLCELRAQLRQELKR